MSKRDTIKRRRMKTYEDMASSNGYPDPLKVLFSQLKSAVQTGREEKALHIASLLLPYGHGKRAPIDDKGDTVREGLTITFTHES